ncbi:ankyrin repeat domain-containing protein 26-like [Aplysia californica]|uniref:Ankyrin repeat domain-containing protein 26-like n=1 Tax=Aplysia californica TaxID=6500 RepID=A0ABM1VY83_APLCA|nr:ankyrin repeat domain-containing protein 26-like [Aplysia californica]
MVPVAFSELEAKQRAELTMRNLQIEMRSSANTIKELEEEREELQRQVTHANNARLLQEQINDDQQKFIHQQTTQQAQHTPRDSKDFDESPELSGDMDKLRAELYALKVSS